MDKYCVCIKNDKHLLKVKERCPGKMMLIHGINYNIIFSYPSYLDVYQHEAKHKSSTKR